MSFLCEWWSCKKETVKHFDKEGFYRLDRCMRCGKEDLVFVREAKKLVNTKENLRALNKCMDEPRFVFFCIRYREHLAAKSIQNASERESALKAFCSKYHLQEGDFVPDPILMFQLNNWYDPDETPDINDTTRLKKGGSASTNPTSAGVQKGNKKTTNRKPGKNRRYSLSVLGELSLPELQEYLDACLAKGEYEKAALIKQEMDRRTGLPGES